MVATRRIAAVLGPTLLAVTTSETINLDIWADVHPTIVYLNGLLFLIVGLTIVTNHSRWRSVSQVLVTLSGWFLIVAGSFRMFFPTTPQLEAGPLTFTLIALLGLLGIALTIVAFGRRSG